MALFLIIFIKFVSGREEFTLIIDDPLSRTFIDGEIDAGMSAHPLCYHHVNFVQVVYT